MHFVKALGEHFWNVTTARNAHGKAVGQRYLIRALEEAMWCLDGVGVEVEPGLVVGSTKQEDQAYFTKVERRQPVRGEIVSVVPGMIIAFENAGDAQHFVEIGQAEAMSEADVAAVMQAMHDEQQQPPTTEEDAMLKAKDIENKAVTPAVETKNEAAPAKPAPKPKKK